MSGLERSGTNENKCKDRTDKVVVFTFLVVYHAQPRFVHGFAGGDQNSMNNAAFTVYLNL